MGIKENMHDLLESAQEHSATLCAIGAVAGVFVTAWLSGRAAVKVSRTIDPNMTRKDKTILYCKTYAATAVSAGITTGLIVGSDRIHVGKEAVLAAGAAIWKEKAMDLDNKIKEELGEEKANELKKKIVEDKKPDVLEKPDNGRKIYCYDPYTDQFFWSSREIITYAMYKANEKLVKDCELTLNFINLILGAKWTKEGEELQWNYDNVVQEDGWAWTGGCWIEMIPDVRTIKGKEAFVIFYQVDPMKQIPEDMVYTEYGGT